MRVHGVCCWMVSLAGAESPGAIVPLEEPEDEEKEAVKVIIQIKKALNGAMVTVDEQDIDVPKREMVFEFDSEDEKVGLEGLVEMLYILIEEMGEDRGKRAMARVSIALAHGSDYCCKTPHCEICGR